MKNGYVIAIDQSTQNTKASLYDEKGVLVARKLIPHRQVVDGNGWVSHDLKEIRNNLFSAVTGVVIEAGIDRNKVVAIGIGNQRESVGLWDRQTGEPVCDSIVWQCNRATKICKRPEITNRADYIRQTCGLKLSPFFSAPKILWMLENSDEARRLLARRSLCCGTMDCWTLFCLTEGRSFKTDASNASRMMLFNLRTGDWDAALCELWGIPLHMLPQVCASDDILGDTDAGGFFPNKVPITSCIGDSHAALYAQRCLEKGSCIAGMGTGTCLMMNIGDVPIPSANGLLTSVAWKINGKTTYAFDGVINYSGAVVTWLVKDLNILDDPAQSDAIVQQANPEDTTVLLPAFNGIGAPYWVDDAQAAFVGMTRRTGRKELVKAALESIALQCRDVIDCMAKDCGKDGIDRLKASGGPAKNRYLMQFLSDILDCPVNTPTDEEMTSAGIALIAGKKIGLYEEDFFNYTVQTELIPQRQPQWRREVLGRWDKALAMVIGGR
jgi:glycerol kinase